MASRSLPPGVSGNSTRSPVRQNVALRWLDNVAPPPAVSKPAHSPVKRWPPPKVEDPVHASAIAPNAVPGPTEKQESVSAFQSARAVFEAKKTSAATPPPPPSRHRLTFPVPPGPPIVKQNSAESDLSSSSCSTVDSESDRKLQENAEAKHEPKPSSQELVGMESATISPSGQAHKILPYKTTLTSPPIAPASQNPLPPEPVVIVTAPKHSHPNHSEIDPFRLLLPVQAVPTLPDEIIFVYDSAAVEMEKNVKKVVRKLLKKNKTKLEEFKVNSRLFGTDFIDAHAYLDTLIKDFGPIRALQLVPCLLSIQPNLVKSNALLLTSKNYLLRHEADLEREFQSLQVSNQKEVTKTEVAPTIEPSATTNVAEKAFIAETVAMSPSVIAPETPSKNKAEIPTRKNCGSPVPGIVDVPSVQPSAPLKKHPTKSFATNKVVRPVEPMPEPHEVTPPGVPPPLINVAVSTSKTLVRVPTTKEAPAVKMRAKSDTSKDSEEKFRAENLFGETIKTPPQSQQPQQRTNNLSVPDPPTSPAPSTRSFEEAESLFGERLSLSSPSSMGQRKSVTWGDTKTVEVRSEKASPVKTVKKPAPLLFGMATAAAFDSDSDESDFSD